jgi:hypothetical protein
MKFNVYGTVRVQVVVEVEAEDEQHAMEVAQGEFDGLTGYAGNGGMDKLVGTSQRNVSLDVGDFYGEFTEAEPA